MTAFSWVWKSPTEIAYVKNIAEAAIWCREQLEGAGVASTAAMASYVAAMTR